VPDDPTDKTGGPTKQEIEDAWAAYDRGEAGQAGIVDHVSF